MLGSIERDRPDGQALLRDRHAYGMTERSFASSLRDRFAKRLHSNEVSRGPLRSSEVS